MSLTSFNLAVILHKKCIVILIALFSSVLRVPAGRLIITSYGTTIASQLMSCRF